MASTGDSDAGGDMSKPMVENSKNKEETPKTCAGIWQWYWAAPIARLPFAIFVVFGLASILWLIMYLAEPQIGYILAGIAAIVMSGYGIFQFKTMLDLKAEVETMAGLNSDFKRKNRALRREVNKLEVSKQNLQGIEDDLRQSNEKLRNSLQKFKQLDEQLNQLSKSNVEGLESVLNQSKKVLEKWNEQIASHERSILNNVFRALQWADGDAGVSEDEFNQLLEALPPKYTEAFKMTGRTFAEIAGDNDTIERREFTGLVDDWVQKVVELGGSK